MAGFDLSDEAGIAAIVVEGFAQETDGAGERTFGDSGVQPDGVEGFLFADEAPAALDEIEEQAERLGLETGEPSAVRGKACRRPGNDRSGRSPA